jgi:hypothetical protein
MGDSDRGSGRLTAARSRHRHFCSFVASGPGIRVVDLHILGMRVQLLSINMGRRRTPFGSRWSPANAAHCRVDRTITVERRHGFVNRCGRGDRIKQSQLPLLVSVALECLRRTIWR